MRRATFLRASVRDLVAIRDFIAEQSGSIATADSFVGRLRAQCHKLAALPGRIGRPRPELREDIRSFPFGNYVIFFRYAGERFEIVTIVEGHRDVEAQVERAT